MKNHPSSYLVWLSLCRLWVVTGWVWTGGVIGAVAGVCAVCTGGVTVGVTGVGVTVGVVHATCWRACAIASV